MLTFFDKCSTVLNLANLYMFINLTIHGSFVHLLSKIFNFRLAFNIHRMKEGFNCDILRSNIRYLRKKMNLSQEDLATMIGLNRGNIASYESGTAEPRIANLVKMSKLFSVPLADLTEKKICEKYVSMSAEEWQKESDRMRAELNNQLDRLKVTKTYYSSILNCKKMFKENNPVLSDDALELEMYFKQLQTLTDKILKTQTEFLDRLSIPTDCKSPQEDS